MINRIYIVCEGQSEEAFIKKVLNPWFYEKTGNCQLFPFTVITSFKKDQGKMYRGGGCIYANLKRDVKSCFGYNQPVTTMIDFYCLSTDFPSYHDSIRIQNPNERVTFLEEKMHADIIDAEPRFRSDFFIPYLELHEFEALFYCDLATLKYEYVEDQEQRQIDKLISEVKGMKPEEINNGSETAPSKRLLRYIDYQKGEAVVSPLGFIGIDLMLEKCPHFKEWIGKLLSVVGTETCFQE